MENKVTADYLDEEGCLHCGTCGKRKQMKVSLMGFEHVVSCDKADDVYGGRLPVHVRVIADEFANIGQIPQFDKLIATIRSREISASIILQSQSQLKAMYKDSVYNFSKAAAIDYVEEIKSYKAGIPMACVRNGKILPAQKRSPLNLPTRISKLSILPYVTEEIQEIIQGKYMRYTCII